MSESKKYFKVGDYPIGIRHLKISKSWIGTGIMYGATGVILLCWLTEWHDVLKYLPYYNKRYQYPWDDKRIYIEPRRDIFYK